MLFDCDLSAIKMKMQSENDSLNDYQAMKMVKRREYYVILLLWTRLKRNRMKETNKISAEKK